MSVSSFPHATSAATLGDVTVSGETITVFTDSGTATAGIRFNTDGTVDKNVNFAYTQIDSSTDWIIPNSAAMISYQIKLTVSSGDSPSSGPSVGIWHDLGTTREWYFQDTNSGTAGNKSGTWLIEIRIYGVVQDSGSYVMSAEYEAPF